MKQLHVFYRIFHDDLTPTKTMSEVRKKEYIQFLSDHTEYLQCNSGLPYDTLSEETLRFHYYEVLLNFNMAQLKEDLHERLFTLSDDEQFVKRLIKKCQVTIKLHLHKIKTEFIPANEHAQIFKCCTTKDAAGIYKLAYRSLVNLHEFLELTCKDYLDLHIAVPCKLRKRFIEQNRVKANSIMEKLLVFEMKPFLREQISEMLHRFMEDRIPGLTYSRMDYCKSYITFLERFLQNTESKNELEFLKLLISLDFNRLGILHYVTGYFKTTIYSQNCRVKQKRTVQGLLKSLGQIPELTECGYHQKRPSLKSRLLDWLECEYQELLIGSEDQKIVPKSDSMLVIPSAKNIVTLSVPDLAALLRVLQENKVFKLSKTDMFRLVSKNFASHKSPDISYKSLSNKYYDVTETSKKNIKQILQKLLVSVDSL